jgi:hypothetical protein
MKRNRFRYRLGSLLWLMLVIALSAAAYGSRLRAVQRQDEAFWKIAAKGGRVLHYEEGAYIDFPRTPQNGLCGTGLRGVFGPSSDRITFGDGDIPLLDDILTIRSIDFSGSQASTTAQDQFKKSHGGCHVTP